MSSSPTKKEVQELVKRQTEVDYGTVTFEEFYGKEQADNMRQKIEDLLKNKKGGFLFIGNMETGVVSDAYMAICGKHVLSHVKKSIADAINLGLIKS